MFFDRLCHSPQQYPLLLLRHDSLHARLSCIHWPYYCSVHDTAATLQWVHLQFRRPTCVMLLFLLHRHLPRSNNSTHRRIGQHDVVQYSGTSGWNCSSTYRSGHDPCCLTPVVTPALTYLNAVSTSLRPPRRCNGNRWRSWATILSQSFKKHVTQTVTLQTHLSLEV